MRSPPTAFPNPWAGAVLVCESERHIARLIEVNLQRQGLNVTCVFDGEEAINQLEASGILKLAPRFTTVVVDMMLSKVNGYDVLKWIRERDSGPPARVVMTVPSAKDREALKMLPYRADAYFVKPFNPMELLR